MLVAGMRTPKILLSPERGVKVGDAFDTDDIAPKERPSWRGFG